LVRRKGSSGEKTLEGRNEKAVGDREEGGVAERSSEELKNRENSKRIHGIISRQRIN